MGNFMASHLLAGGYRVVTAVHRRAPSTDLLDAGLRVVETAAEAAAEADIVITMLPDTPDVEEVLFGSSGVATGLREGSLVIDMSSISPSATVDFAGRIKAIGAQWLDAPVSGGDVGARAGTLTIMAGGDPAAFDRALPVLRVMGSTVTRIGLAGAGQTCKAANQIVVAGVMSAVAEGLLFAAANGVDPGTVRTAMLGGLANSRVLDLHGSRMIDREFAPGFRARLHSKDLNIALSVAREKGIVLPGTSSAQQLLVSLVAHGGGDLDHSALIKSLELLNGRRVNEPSRGKSLHTDTNEQGD
jgi:2-hydroxy-3-oxopropionate reductase